MEGSNERRGWRSWGGKAALAVGGMLVGGVLAGTLAASAAGNNATQSGGYGVPGYGALTTNCDLPHAMAKGLHRRPGTAAWLHVSAGLGTHPTAPVRFACRPEATILTLIPR